LFLSIRDARLVTGAESQNHKKSESEIRDGGAPSFSLRFWQREGGDFDLS
jgi:hypothetical protein